MKVNVNKPRVMINGERGKCVETTRTWPCGVCGRGVGIN